MDELELYTVNVFQAPDKRDQNSDEQKPHDNMSFIEAFPNMISARVIKVSGSLTQSARITRCLV